MIVTSILDNEDTDLNILWFGRYKHNPRVRSIISRSESDDKFSSTFSMVLKQSADNPYSFTFKLTKEGNNLVCKETHYVWNSRQIIQ